MVNNEEVAKKGRNDGQRSLFREGGVLAKKAQMARQAQRRQEQGEKEKYRKKDIRNEQEATSEEENYSQGCAFL